MPILSRDDSLNTELAPGVDRWRIVDSEIGAESLSVADLTVDSGSTIPNHTHPTEEAMYILDGELVAILGDNEVPVSPGQTVLAPPGVRHGFVNRSGGSARLIAIFPTANMEKTLVD
ncbi:MAG TPA: cupin domain-containing protein [Dehalococcoidia bacterium]|jgi:quercetin dioxygenase-like cupin family protein|nr:cupin domain-containing protein [Dehalococcoidia bacterium]